MVVAYWIVAGLLALFFLYAGGIKIVRSADQLRPMMSWIDSMPFGLVRTIGALEVLGAIGLDPAAADRGGAMAVAGVGDRPAGGATGRNRRPCQPR